MSDTPMHRRLFVEMTQPEQDAFIDNLRQRRLVAVNKHAELLKLKQLAMDDKLRKMVDTQSKQMEKEITTCTKALDKIELRYNKIAGLRSIIESEAGRSVDDVGTDE